MNPKIKEAIDAAMDRQLTAKVAPIPAPPPQPASPWAALIPPVPSIRKPEFSIVMCSPPQNEEKFKSVEMAYRIAMQGEDYELIRISDARSMAEGYLRGIEQSSGSILIFSHDDAAPVRPIGAKLRRHLRHVDIVGGAGSDRLDGPAWFTAGPPHVAGQVLNQMGRAKLDSNGQPMHTPDGQIIGEPYYLLSVYGVPSRLVKNIQVLDGFWIACNREVLHPSLAWFDPITCDNFHGYDIDFSFGAYLRGVRIGVATDLSLLHASSGGYSDPKWKPTAEKLKAKYADQWSQHKALEWGFTSVQGADQGLVLATMDRFVENAEG
jgi:hypothetical protein